MTLDLRAFRSLPTIKAVWNEMRLVAESCERVGMMLVPTNTLMIFRCVPAEAT